MPRGRGGRRQGKPGGQYANRSDLQQGPRALPVKTVPGQGYGEAAQQQASQQAVPMGTPSAPAPPSPDQLAAHPSPLPGELPPLDAPTSNPNEPVTAGLPTGPGPGPEALNGGGPDNVSLDQLRAIYLRFPSEDLRRLIATAENQNG